MEAVLLLLDALAVMALVFTSLRNDRLNPGENPSGPFRYRASPRPKRNRRRRTGQAASP